MSERAVTIEVLENLVHIGTVASRACAPKVQALEVSRNLCKIQKLVVSMRKKIREDNLAPGIGDRIHPDVDWMIDKCLELGKQIGARFGIDEHGRAGDVSFYLYFDKDDSRMSVW